MEQAMCTCGHSSEFHAGGGQECSQCECQTFVTDVDLSSIDPLQVPSQEGPKSDVTPDGTE